MATMSQSNNYLSKTPESIGSLVSLLIRKSIDVFAERLPLLLLLFAGGLVLHTFLLIGPNGGFWWTPNLMGDFLASKGNTFTGLLLWILIPGIVIGNLRRVKRLGLNGYFQCFKAGLEGGITAYNKIGKPALTFLLVSMAVGIGIISITRNQLLGLVLGFCMFSALATKSESFWFLIMRLSWIEFQKRSNKADINSIFDFQKASIITAGIGLGSLIGFIIPGIRFYGISGFVLIVVIVAAVWFLSSKKGTIPPSALLIALIGLALTFNFVQVVRADDGGWDESGGNFNEWINSEGATEAVGRGASPATGAVVGVVGAVAAETVTQPSTGEDIKKKIKRKWGLLTCMLGGAFFGVMAMLAVFLALIAGAVTAGVAVATLPALLIALGVGLVVWAVITFLLDLFDKFQSIMPL